MTSGSKSFLLNLCYIYIDVIYNYSTMMKRENIETKSWKDIKDAVYGTAGTARRDALDLSSNDFKAGIAKKTKIKNKKTEDYPTIMSCGRKPSTL